jgi:hypothetical protein
MYVDHLYQAKSASCKSCLTAVRVQYAGNAATRCPGSCIATGIMTSDATAPNGDRGVDGLLSVLAHEVTEAITRTPPANSGGSVPVATRTVISVPGSLAQSSPTAQAASTTLVSLTADATCFRPTG